MFVIYFAVWWCVYLNDLPGLHGDEAWSGIKADEIERGENHVLYGMNTYTGLIEAVAVNLCFKMFGVSVGSMRLPGAIFNLIGILIFIRLFLKKRATVSLLVFLAILSQSLLYLTSPRIAWEVNSFSLFFFAIFCYSIDSYYQDNSRVNRLAIVTFFIVNILGIYNHVIFSSLSVSCFFGLLLWTLYYNSLLYKSLLILLAINFFNMLCCFLFMRYGLEYLELEVGLLIPILFALIIALELIIYEQLQCHWHPKIPQFKYTPLLVALTLVFSTSLFIWFHGIAFMEMLSGCKILLQTYSYESNLLVQSVLSICAIIFIIYLIKFIASDFLKKSNSIPIFTVICYLGILTTYITLTSFRYYLIIYVMIALYMSFKIGSNIRSSAPFLFSIMIAFVVINIIQINIFTYKDRPVKAIKFSIGNGQIETSEHFLPKRPLIDFLKTNKVGNIINHTDNPYFISKPLYFYKLMSPWNQDSTKSAHISYDFSKEGSGFLIQLESQR